MNSWETFIIIYYLYTDNIIRKKYSTLKNSVQHIISGIDDDDDHYY